MRIVFRRPPNFDKIAAAFPGAQGPGVLFCYGDAIYNPSHTAISPALHAHETAHSIQQGGDPETWWGKYIELPAFRFEQELAAHATEYCTATNGQPRHERRRVLALLAKRLSGPLYGRVVSLDQAKAQILSIAAAATCTEGAA